MIVGLTPEVEADLAQARRWHRQHGSRAAREFVRAVEAALELVTRYPEGQPIVYRSMRRVLLRRILYAPVHFCARDVTVIIGCFHAARDPRTRQERSDAALD